MSFRLDPKANQTVVFEFTTGHKQVKVVLNLHFCKGSKRFRCTVSKDPNRKVVEIDTLNAPVEIKYTGDKRTSKFYAFINFQEECSLNITPKIYIIADPVVHSQREEEPSTYRKDENDPTSKYYHINLINELEKMEILPPSLDSVNSTAVEQR